MIKHIKLLTSVLVILFVFPSVINSQTSTPQEPEKIQVKDSSVVPAPSNFNDDAISYISGVPDFKNECFSKIDPKINWNKYSKNLDSLFSTGNALRMKKMKVWADSELVKKPTIKTVFYPFSGPDILNANIYYPEVDQYILIGLEPVGELPDICKMTPAAVQNYLDEVSNTLTDLLKRSYFITMHMSKDLSKENINGTLPMMALLLKRTGHQIISVHKIGIDSLGICQIIDDLKDTKGYVHGVKIDFTTPPSDKVQSVYYFRTDISDKGLDRRPRFKKYLSSLPESYTFLKAASFLMHYDEFSYIRNCIFNVSTSIIQDDSGIAFKYFDQKKWDIKLYGKYFKPKGEFSYINEPDLEKAYQQTKVRDLPYSLGYNWRSGHTNLLYATKK